MLAIYWKQILKETLLLLSSYMFIIISYSIWVQLRKYINVIIKNLLGQQLLITSIIFAPEEWLRNYCMFIQSLSTGKKHIDSSRLLTALISKRS